MSFRFGGFELDEQRFELRHEGALVPVTRQVFDLLAYLIRHRDRVVPRRELLDELWSDRVVTDNALSQSVAFARRALGDQGGTLIQTVYGRGFRFVGDAEEYETSSAAPAPSALPELQGRTLRGFEDRPAIAVLPFASSGGPDPEHAYFASGITEDLATRLARIRYLPVIARGSTSSYRSNEIDLGKVSRDLGARYLIEGSVRRSGRRVRITVRLTDGLAGQQVWAERYDRELQDVFALQDEISASIMGQLGAVVYRHEVERTAPLDPSTLSAWELYVQAGGIFMNMDREGCMRARALARQAVELAPSFTDAWALLALTYAFDFWGDDAGGGLLEARRLAEHALRFDDTHPGAHTILGGVCSALGEHARALAHLERARDLDPCSAVNRWLLAQTQTAVGRAEEAIETLYLAMRLSPNDPWMFDFMLSVTIAQFAVDDYAQAIYWARRSLERRPDYPLTHVWLAASLAQQGEADEARDVLERLARLNPEFSFETLQRIRPMQDQVFARAFYEGLAKAGWIDPESV